jgi:hypothetical protein
MVELVQQIANVRSFKWWEIFPPADLISIMGSDNAEVAGIIHNMLFTQFVEGDDLNLQVHFPKHRRFYCVQLKRSYQPPSLVSAMSASLESKIFGKVTYLWDLGTDHQCAGCVECALL